MAALHIELAKEEAATLQEGNVHLHETSPLMFVQTGLDLEDQQCVCRFLCN